MNRPQLAFFLSGFGIFAFACGEASSDAPAGNAAADLSAADQFAMTQVLGRLPQEVEQTVRDALAAQPGPRSQHAFIQLFGASKIIDLAKAYDSLGCTRTGAAAIIVLANWAKHASADDATQASALDAMRAKLPQIDLDDLDATLDLLACADKGTSGCQNRVFTPPSCDGTTNNNGTACTTTAAGCTFNEFEQQRAGVAASKLASVFRELDAVRPSAGMQSEWNDFRTRYQARLGHAAAEALRSARRSGSATVARDGDAQRRFDEGARLVDAFRRGDVAFDAGAMDLLHAAVSTDRTYAGRVRTAGQEAFLGRGAARSYLPGAAVARATSDVFREVASRRSNGDPTPLVAAMFDQRIISIHPYMDANGRTTRLMTDWLLTKGGFPPALTNDATRATIALWEQPRVARDAHLEHITEGMRRSVELVEAV